MTADLLLNPFRTGLSPARNPEPCAMAIFGASGDLASRKLVPALYNLAHDGLLPSAFAVIGLGRRPKTQDEFRAEMKAAVEKYSRRRPPRPAALQALTESLSYVHAEDEAELYPKLAAELRSAQAARGTAGNRIFYLATPPSVFGPTAVALGAHGLVSPRATGTPWTRIIVEKPFGVDLDSARQLNATLKSVFREAQIYRIDHYLGKETVQNILALRFANAIFEPLWNQRHVDHVQITASETLGVEARGNYFEQAGALRDMVQSHLLQLLALVTMEPPVTFEADAIHDEKRKALRAIRPLDDEVAATDVVRGQYGAGVIGGVEVPAYRQEPGVDPASVTETFVALKLELDNWRWAQVPFYLRTGKRLAKRAAEIAIQFKAVPHQIFRSDGSKTAEANALVLRLQPEEGISLRFGSKPPGPAMRIQPVKMDFQYGSSFGVDTPEAYERLILDAMLGDSTLFTRDDEVETAWSVVMPVLRFFERHRPSELPAYQAGSWGPPEAFQLIERDGRRWRRL